MPCMSLAWTAAVFKKMWHDFHEFDIASQYFSEFDIALHDFSEFDIALHYFSEFDIAAASS